jgi:hypothetical protein
MPTSIALKAALGNLFFVAFLDSVNYVLNGSGAKAFACSKQFLKHRSFRSDNAIK